MADEKTPTDRDMERLRRAKRAIADRLLRIPGVHSVGIGYKRVGGELTDELAVIAYVDEKVSRDELDADRLIPPEIRVYTDAAGDEEVVPTDVVQRPRPVEYPHLADGSLAVRVRPVPGGFSIQGPNGGGTLGGWVWDDQNDDTVLLSNNHVLGGMVGADVFQPWGSTAAADHIADIVRTGTLDASIAAPTASSVVQYEIAGITPAVYEVAEATIGMAVEKSGATTEHTTGTVIAVDISSHYGHLYFDIARDAGIDRFAYYGDSGSLIVERTNPSGSNWKRVVGLLWGGQPVERNGYAHQIQDVFANVGLKTICAGLIEAIIDALFGSGSEMASVEEASDRPHGGHGRPAGGSKRPGWGRFDEKGFARDLERRLMTTDQGQRIVKAVHGNRVGLLRTLLDGDVRRATSRALHPFIDDVWSVDELFERPMSADDIANFRRLLASTKRHHENLGDLVPLADELLGKAEGRRLSELLGQ